METVPSLAAVAKRCPYRSNLTRSTDGMTYGGGPLTAGRTPYVADAFSRPNSHRYVCVLLEPTRKYGRSGWAAKV